MTLNLIQLITQYQDDIAIKWAALIYQNASFHPEETWMETLVYSTTYALNAMRDFLTTGSLDSLTAYLSELNKANMRDGFQCSEVIEALLLCKDAVTPIIFFHVSGSATIQDDISNLDTCLRRMVVYYNSIYDTEINHRIHRQNEHIVTMLDIGQKQSDDLKLKEVLNQVAEAIIFALQVDHCDFYLTGENPYELYPKVGVHHKPHYIADILENHVADIRSDPFYREVMLRKEPVACWDAQTNPIANQEVNTMIGTKSIFAVPLVSHDKVFAVAVTGTFDQHRAFTAEQIELAWNFASAAALVIENTHMREKIRHMAVSEERERLAREIHDNLAQALSLVNLQVSHIQSLLQSGEIDQGLRFLNALKRMVVEAHTDARDAIFSLRNSASHPDNFLATLRAYLERYQENYSIDVNLLTPDDPPINLPAEAAIQLMRIIQEALTNVRKHAAASRVNITIEQHPDTLLAIIKDDGRGFDAKSVLKNQNVQVGLQIMRERTEGLGGHFTIDTAPGQGTCLTVNLPLIK